MATAGDDTRKLAGGAGLALGGSLIGRSFHVFSQVVLARGLGVEAYGVYAIGWTLLRLVSVLGPLGLEKGVIRFGSAVYRKDPAALRGVLMSSLGIATGTGTLLGAGLFAVAEPLARDVFAKPELAAPFRIFALGFPVVAALKVGAAATRVSERMQFGAIAEDIVQPFAGFGLLILLWLSGMTLPAACAAAVLAFGLALAVCLKFLAGLYPEARPGSGIQRKPAPGLLAFSLPTALTGVFTMVLLWMDRLFLGYFVERADVGVYQAASQGAIVLTMILGALNSILSPMAARSFHAGEQQRAEELYRLSTKWGLYVCTPILIVILTVPGDLLHCVFGEAFHRGGSALRVLTVGQFLNVATGACGLMLVMSGNQRLWMTYTGLMAAVSVGLNLMLIPRYGMMGAAWGTATSVALLFLGGLMIARIRVGVWPYDRRMRKFAMAGAAGLVAAGAGTQLADWIAVFLIEPGTVDIATTAAGDLPSALLRSGVTAALAFLSFGSVVAWQGLDPEDRELLGSLRSRFRPQAGAN